KSPSNLESTQRPPVRTVLTSVPLEIAGSASGPDMYDLIVASQVPSSRARILCSSVGFAPGWAIAGALTIDATTQSPITDFHRSIACLLQNAEGGRKTAGSMNVCSLGVQ